MSDSVLQKYGIRRPDELRAEQIGDVIDDMAAFGWLRGNRDRAAMLELRRRDGAILAINYGWLQAEFDPSEGITLRIPERTIRIKGRNLNTEVRPGVSLFSGICRHRVPWVEEAPRTSTFVVSESLPIVDVIEW